MPLGASISEVYWLRGGGDDDPGALWVGTRTAGLLRLEAGSWLALDRSSGLPADQVLGLLETKDADGQPVHWVGTADGLAVIRGSRVSVEGAAEGLPGPQVLALAELRERGRAPEIWASIVGLGLVRRVGDRWVRVDARPAFNADHGVWLLASTTPDGARGAVGGHRAQRPRAHGARALERAHAADGLPSDHVVGAARDRDAREADALGGHARRGPRRGGGRPRDAQVWNRSSGLPNDDALALAELRLAGGRRELWVGTRAGVARRDLDAAVSRLVPARGGPDAVRGRRPRCCRSARTAPAASTSARSAASCGSRRSVRPEPGAEEFASERFGVADGLPSATANWRQLLDSRGRIWIATTGGIALLDPAHEAAFAAPPAPLLIERAQATSTGLAIEHGATLPFGAHDVLFEYALLTPRRRRRRALSHAARGLRRRASRRGWRGPRRPTPTCPRASYVFRVEARDAAGLRSGPVELASRSSPARGCGRGRSCSQALGLVGLVTLLVRARERALRRRAEELEALVAERTRQLQEANAQLSELSVTDPLTGLANRRALEAHAEGEWRRVARAGGSLAFVMVDVDLLQGLQRLARPHGGRRLPAPRGRARCGAWPSARATSWRATAARSSPASSSASSASRPRRTPSGCAPRSRSSACRTRPRASRRSSRSAWASPGRARRRAATGARSSRPPTPRSTAPSRAAATASSWRLLRDPHLLQHPGDLEGAVLAARRSGRSRRRGPPAASWS